MDKEKEYSIRKDPRLKGFNYSAAGIYFITICTQNKRKILSQIVGGDVLDAPPSVELLPRGKIADKIIKQFNDFYENISVEAYVIMPNHIHLLLYVKPLHNGASRTSPPTRQHSTVSQFVSTFKRFCNKEIGENIWQLSFYDHIIRDKEDYQNHAKYIYDNPMNWSLDELYSKE